MFSERSLFVRSWAVQGGPTAAGNVALSPAHAYATHIGAHGGHAHVLHTLMLVTYGVKNDVREPALGREGTTCWAWVRPLLRSCGRWPPTQTMNCSWWRMSTSSPTLP